MVPLNRCRCEHAATCHTIARILGWAIVAAATLMATDRAGAGPVGRGGPLRDNNAHILLAPYVGNSPAPARRRGPRPPCPAHLPRRLQGLATLDVMIDGTANRDCPADGMPVVEYSIDGGQFHPRYDMAGQTGSALRGWQARQRRATSGRVLFPLSPAVARPLGIAGHAFAAGGARPRGRRFAPPLPCPAKTGDRLRRLDHRRGLLRRPMPLLLEPDARTVARATWFPVVATALDCEYGQLGRGDREC